MQNYKDLKVWKKGHLLAPAMPKTSKNFPQEELYNITRQFGSASISISTTIAEGCKKSTNKDLGNFLLNFEKERLKK